MALVAYSDSEGSDEEVPQSTVVKPTSKTSTNFTVDKSNPGTIRVNIQQKNEPRSNSNHDDEPAAKRQRIGAGAFSSFNSMLPAPKRDGLTNIPDESTKATPQKVFSLKTGAKASFSRESDAELRNSLAEQNGTQRTISASQPNSLPMPAFAKPAAPAASGTPFMFKPLSVSRTSKKKRNVAASSSPKPLPEQGNSSSQSQVAVEAEPPPKKKISLFSAGADPVPLVSETVLESENVEEEYESHQEASEEIDTYSNNTGVPLSTTQPQSLDRIATDLNLTTAQRRQLFGRSGQPGISAINVVNFNTDDEYAANQALIAAGDTVQHNPVRAIAPGKHSLRQLVNAAAGQKDALEESFAEGRRNKKEAGSKYGW